MLEETHRQITAEACKHLPEEIRRTLVGLACSPDSFPDTWTDFERRPDGTVDIVDRVVSHHRTPITIFRKYLRQARKFWLRNREGLNWRRNPDPRRLLKDPGYRALVALARLMHYIQDNLTPGGDDRVCEKIRPKLRKDYPRPKGWEETWRLVWPPKRQEFADDAVQEATAICAGVAESVLSPPDAPEELNLAANRTWGRVRVLSPVLFILFVLPVAVWWGHPVRYWFALLGIPASILAAIAGLAGINWGLKAARACGSLLVLLLVSTILLLMAGTFNPNTFGVSYLVAMVGTVGALAWSGIWGRVGTELGWFRYGPTQLNQLTSRLTEEDACRR
jgi:hypothetical protein